MSWTFPLFRLFGIPVRMHWLLAVMIAGRLIQGLSGWGLWGLEWMAITMAILLVSILFHELSHCWMGIRMGGHAERILLWPLGGLAYIEHDSRPGQQILISGIGPLSSFLLGGICAGILLLSGAAWQWEYLNPWADWWPYGLTTAQGFLVHAVRLNLILGLFNLCVPAYPLDGGVVLYAFLSIRHGREKAAEVAAYIGIPVGLAMGIWGIAMEEFNMILIGTWVLIEAFQLRHLVKIGELSSHPAFSHVAPEYDYMPERAKKKGWFARRREKRARERELREAESRSRLRERVDEVLDKVSREGIGALSTDERRILEEASRKSKGE